MKLFIRLIIITTLIMSCIGLYAVGTCIIGVSSDDINYNNTTVKSAIDELYTLASTQYYCPYRRGENGTPTTLCSRITDAFGVNSGNKKSTYKVGFITSDEENLAGISWSYGMKDYLYNNMNYWIGSPINSSSSYAGVFYVSFDNAILYGYYTVTNTYGVRPVVSLKANTSYTGTGTLTDPYTVN